MRTLSLLSTVALVTLGSMSAYSQNREAEVPGDNFSLEGALELFKQSESPEHFEKLLNSPDSKVNNLDLNGDGYTDYIRVFDRYEGDVHVFIMQAVVSDSENQDIAVIELEKKANGQAVLQIIGDEDIYGVTTIIEPTREVRTYAGANTTNTVVNVWSWPVVQYVYGPRYVVWHSYWGWYHRPIWWNPWRPVVYVSYYDYWRPYYSYYAVCSSRRVYYGHHIYHPYRSTSVIVYNRHHDRVNRYRTAYRDNGYGRDRYSDHRRNADDHSNGRIADRDRSRSNSREANASPSSRERNVNNYQRNSSETRRDDFIRNRPNSETREQNRGDQRTIERTNSRSDFNRSSDTNTSREFREQISRPRENRSSSEQNSNNVDRNSQMRQRSTPDFQRNTPRHENRGDFQRQQPSEMRNSREFRQEVSRPSMRSSSSGPQQRQSSVQRSAPSGGSEIRQQPGGRSSGGGSRSSEGRRGRD
jgi:hypothetical protein